MYHEHFGFEQDPFNITPDSAFLFPSRRHREAMAALMYGIEQRKGFIALTGEIGSGKTTICRALLKELDRDSVRVALILNPQLSDLELLQAINAEYGIDAASDSKRALLDTLNKHLLEQYEQDRNCVLIIDESQRLSTDALEQIRLISNLELESTKLIQIALVGQPELDDLLHLPELEQLNQRIMVRYHIDPLGQEEMAEYIEHRLTVANPDHKVKFHKKALRVIYDHTDGIPRRINVLCDRALLVTYVAGAFEITEDRARQAITETTSRRAGKRPSKSNEETRRMLGATSVRGSDVFLPPGVESRGDNDEIPAQRSSRGGGVLLFVGCLAVAGAIVYAAIQFSGASAPSRLDAAPTGDDRLGSTQVAQLLVPVTPTPQPIVEDSSPPPTPSPTPQPSPIPTPRTLTFQPVDRPAHTPAVTPQPESEPATPLETDQELPVGEWPVDEAATPEAEVAFAQDEPGPDSVEPPVSSSEEEVAISEGLTEEEVDLLIQELPTPVELAAWYYDGTGVLRVDRPELTYAASVLTWVSLTQDQQLDDADLADLAQLDAITISQFEMTKGVPPLYLREARVPGVLSILSAEHLPALVQVDRRAEQFGPWAVIIDRVDGEVVLADPIRGRILVSEEEINEYLASVHILYTDPEGITDLSPTDSGERVQALQRRLSQLGLLTAPPTGVFDSRTRRALEEYRQYKQLPGGLDIDPVLAVSLIGDTAS